jgi:hypothetical protein
MAEPPITLKAFFCEDTDKPIIDCLDADAVIQTARKAAGELPRAVVPGFQKAFGGALDGLFEPRLDDILARSWGKLQAVQEAVKATGEDPAALAVIPLLDHRITSNHAPHIDLVWGEKSLCRLAFSIALSLELRGVELEVREGRIHALTSGHLLGEGVFGLAGQTLIKRATPALHLPGRLHFRREPQG